MPFIVCVTGGVASGKSAATQRFEALGIPVHDADLVAREVVEPGTEGLAEIAAHFGPSVIAPDGSLDRPAMRERVFVNPDARLALEAIIHPRVRTLLRHRAHGCDRPTPPYVIVAVPLLAESEGDWSWLDRVLVIDVPRAVQHARLMARDGMDTASAYAMINAQATRAERLAIANDVIVNDGPLAALDAAITTLHTRYTTLAHRDCTPEPRAALPTVRPTP